MFSAKKSVLLLLPVLILAFSAADAGAVWFGVQWGSPVRTIQVIVAGYNSGNQYGAGIAPATGREGATSTAVSTGVGATTYSPVFCVDLTRYASSGYSAYQVDVHTEADGNTGWTTPTGDNDQLRSATGLAQAAYLANTFGASWSTDANSIVNGATSADKWARTIGLNVAIWKAAYGSNFTYVSGLSATYGGYSPETYYNYYVTFIGNTSNRYKWWDSTVNDTNSEHQDFMAAVPEPSSLLLLGSVLALGSGIVTIRRRKRSV